LWGTANSNQYYLNIFKGLEAFNRNWRFSHSAVPAEIRDKDSIVCNSLYLVKLSQHKNFKSLEITILLMCVRRLKMGVVFSLAVSEEIFSLAIGI
jgi:hypothetical protein